MRSIIKHNTVSCSSAVGTDISIYLYEVLIKICVLVLSKKLSLKMY